LNWQAQNFKDLFTSGALNGNIGPQFQWNLLNYGRIRNNIILQDATFKQLVVAYQAQVLQASQEVESGIVTFLKAQTQAKLMEKSVAFGREGVGLAIKLVRTGRSGVAGEVDFERYVTIEQTLVTQQDLMAQAQGQIAQGLIEVYRGLGGGWEMRCVPAAAPPNQLQMPVEQPAPGGNQNKVPEPIPTPPSAPVVPGEPAVSPQPPLPPEGQ